MQFNLLSHCWVTSLLNGGAGTESVFYGDLFIKKKTNKQTNKQTKKKKKKNKKKTNQKKKKKKNQKNTRPYFFCPLYDK